MDGLLDGVIVAEPLPLGIHRVHASTREHAQPDEPLPVDLVLVLLARIVLGDLEDLDELANGESCPLA